MTMIQELWFAFGKQKSTAIRLLTLLRVCDSMRVVERFSFLCLNLAKCKQSERLKYLKVTTTPLGFAKILPRDVKTGEKP